MGGLGNSFGRRFAQRDADQEFGPRIHANERKFGKQKKEIIRVHSCDSRLHVILETLIPISRALCDYCDCGCGFCPHAIAEQIPHRFCFGKPQRQRFGMACWVGEVLKEAGI
jgi:hypothetical protein